jgi:hypothetical protein
MYASLTSIFVAVRVHCPSTGCVRILGSDTTRGQIAVFEHITVPAYSIVNGQCFIGLSLFPINSTKCPTGCARASKLVNNNTWAGSLLPCSNGVNVLSFFQLFTPSGTCDSTAPAPTADTATSAAPLSSSIGVNTRSLTSKSNTGAIVAGGVLYCTIPISRTHGTASRQFSYLMWVHDADVIP